MTTDAEIHDALTQIATNQQRIDQIRQRIDQQLQRLGDALNEVDRAAAALSAQLPH